MADSSRRSRRSGSSPAVRTPSRRATETSAETSAGSTLPLVSQPERQFVLSHKSSNTNYARARLRVRAGRFGGFLDDVVVVVFWRRDDAQPPLDRAEESTAGRGRQQRALRARDGRVAGATDVGARAASKRGLGELRAKCVCFVKISRVQK